MEGLRDIGALVGRILLALIFVLSGFGKVTTPAVIAGYMAHAGIPGALVYPGLILSIFVELGCGLLVMLGLYARLAALIIFLWLIPVTLLFHVAGHAAAVQAHNATAALTQQIMYMKNLSMMGGLLLIASLGPGRLSLNGRGATTEMARPRRAA